MIPGLARFIQSLVFLLLFLVHTAACHKMQRSEGFPSPNEEPKTGGAYSHSQASCQPEFPDAQGWLGADAAFSVPFEGEETVKSLWLFGDSFVATPQAADPSKNPQRRTYPFIHNSIGLSRCDENGQWRFAPYWPQSPDGHASAFFRPERGARWVEALGSNEAANAYYWPFDGFFDEGILYVGLLRVVPGQAIGEFNLPFRLMGMDLARVSNPNDPPESWHTDVQPWSEDPRFIPGSAFVVHEGFVYAFTFLNHEVGRSPRALARISLGALRNEVKDPGTPLEFLAPDRSWVRNPEPHEVAILMRDDATEMSVHYDEASQSWIAVYASPKPAEAQGVPTSIFARTAAHLTGPWSTPRPIFTIPETIPDAEGRFDENIFCYAGKAHPQFSRPGEFLLSYVCNLYARTPAETPAILERLAESPDLYRAKIVRIPMPAWTQ